MVDVPDALLHRLLETRKAHSLPAQLRPLARTFIERTLGALFPHFATAVVCTEAAMKEELLAVVATLEQLERAVGQLHAPLPASVAARFLDALGLVHERLREDADAIFKGDPAAKSVDEVLLTYPGFFAIAVFRVAHALVELGLPLVPRLLTEHAHEKTGIDIHPGATIGRRFCIDHGTGVVIGETSVIGDGVKLYQGVTLGALTVEKSLADKKRHPTIEDEVVLYAAATILGGQTVVGHHSVVAGNAWLTTSVPPYSVVTRRSEVRTRANPGDEIEFMI